MSVEQSQPPSPHRRLMDVINAIIDNRHMKASRKYMGTEWKSKLGEDELTFRAFFRPNLSMSVIVVGYNGEQARLMNPDDTETLSDDPMGNRLATAFEQYLDLAVKSSEELGRLSA